MGLEYTDGPGLAVAVVARSEETGYYLMQRYKGGRNDGLWGFAGGKVEPGENPKTTGLRELLEEAGMFGYKMRPLDYWCYDKYEDTHFVCIYLECVVQSCPPGPEVMEPDKTWAWRFVSRPRLMVMAEENMVLPGIKGFVFKNGLAAMA